MPVDVALPSLSSGRGPISLEDPQVGGGKVSESGKDAGHVGRRDAKPGGKGGGVLRRGGGRYPAAVDPGVVGTA